MYVAFKKGEEQVKPKKPTRKEMIQRWAVNLEAKWRARDRAEAVKKLMKDGKIKHPLPAQFAPAQFNSQGVRIEAVPGRRISGGTLNP